MKTLEKLTFPQLENEYLENILRELAGKYNIVQMFFTRAQSSLFSKLIINIESSIDAQKHQHAKWVRKVKERLQIDVLFIFTSKIRHHYSLGDPFKAFYCHESAVIYQNNEFADSTFKTVEWKKFKKRFNEFENNFHHDHQLHKWQIKNLISEGSSNSVFTSYSRLIEYDLQWLEELYIGNRSDSADLNERINNLIRYIPVIQKYFVKTAKGGYYLIDLFEQAKEASSDEEAMYRNEMFKAVENAEESLYGLIGDRFNEFRKLIKKGFVLKQEVLCDAEPSDKVLKTAVQTILDSADAEQIYFYSKAVNHSKTSYYLLIIGEGLGNEKLKSITNCIKSRTEGRSSFVLISHSRYWIQNNLYEYQNFFQKIIKEEFLIYSSNMNHPDFHWESPHRPYHGDIDFFYRWTEQSFRQFSMIANNADGNYCGLTTIFSLFFMSFCRTYIFAKTYYMPNYLPSQTLWELCIYAEPDMIKHNYLTEQFWTGFFPFLDRNRAVFNWSSRLTTEEINQMRVIAEKLMHELDLAVVEGELVKNFGQKDSAN
ncbi:hypothetical protein [Flavobacterium tistrianum]|uniref:hypothetical protein n=1 Tax=Flavobacterium tistrianum TaxID=1685414 RepID=UPI000DAB9842|nr:hypothetical protein [Flavobacterium tistrianum]KAF2342268.1 hypothetical protein DMB71_05080 [Flavobacterium tistrianum]